MKEYVDEGNYFAVNRARQYGKTTTLNALKRRLENEYKIFLISFEGIEEEVFADSSAFCVRLIGLLYDTIDFGEVSGIPEEIKEEMYQRSIGKPQEMDFRILTNLLSRICQRSEKPVVLMVDEADQAGNYQVLATFLGCLRDMYLKRDTRPAFQSVILAGVYDIKNLKEKIRPEKERAANSPWNMAADFDVDMSLSVNGIVSMLKLYEYDYHTGMAVQEIAQNRDGNVVLANRIFETRLYNRFLSVEELRENDIYSASVYDKNQFVIGGHLNMRLILEKFVEHFNELYANREDKFIEETGRKLFLLYLRPIINGTGNYYIESRTRNMGRTDVIVDYRGERYITEMKIWRGKEYHERGEKQMVGYLEDYHEKTGYMLSLCFNKKKQVGVHEIIIGDKKVIEAMV